MTEHDTQERIINLICNDLAKVISRDDVSFESSLFDDFQLESIQLVELFTLLETEFSIEIDDDDMDFQHFVSVNTLAAFVNSVVAKSS